MTYSTGLLRHRVQILQRVQQASEFGSKGGAVTYEPIKTVWAEAKFTKGAKALREGALDAYDTVMFRMRYTNSVNRDNFIGYQGKVYQIMSFNADYQDNIIQITATEIVGKITET